MSYRIYYPFLFLIISLGNKEILALDGGLVAAPSFRNSMNFCFNEKFDFQNTVGYQGPIIQKRTKYYKNLI